MPYGLTKREFSAKLIGYEASYYQPLFKVIKLHQ